MPIFLGDDFSMTCSDPWLSGCGSFYRRYRPVWQVLLLLGIAGLAGCTPRTFETPLTVALNRDRETSHRLAAVQQVCPIGNQSQPQEIIKALDGLAWSDRQPMALRTVAIDALLEYNAEQFWQAADKRIIEVDSWPVMEYLFAKAVDVNQTKFTGTAIRSYARVSQRYRDDERPERDVIQALNPDQSVEQVLAGVFLRPNNIYDMRHQVAAWTVLCRLTDLAFRRELLEQAPGDTMLVASLQQAACVVDELPLNREGILWLYYLQGEPTWNDAVQRIETFSEEQREGLALRHLPLLVQMDQQRLAVDEATLRQRVEQRLVSRGHVQRTESRLLKEPPDESFDAQQERLVWADLLVIDCLLDATQDRALVESWFAQAEEDRGETDTELGGVLAWENEQLGVVPFEPWMRGNDHKYYSSPALVSRLYTGLVHYHFHAHDHRNAEFAGPGAGDLDFATHLQAGCLVLTFIDEYTLNVDYYQSGGVVVDLGVLSRR